LIGRSEEDKIVNLRLLETEFDREEYFYGSFPDQDIPGLLERSFEMGKRVLEDCLTILYLEREELYLEREEGYAKRAWEINRMIGIHQADYLWLTGEYYQSEKV